MTLEDAERIVLKSFPGAFAFISDDGWWSICNGSRSRHGNIRIPGVSWHETAEAAWMAAVKLVQAGKDKEQP